MLEVENGCPVVGEIFLECTGCAGGETREIIRGVHGDIEPVVVRVSLIISYVGEWILRVLKDEEVFKVSRIGRKNRVVIYVLLQQSVAVKSEINGCRVIFIIEMYLMKMSRDLSRTNQPVIS